MLALVRLTGYARAPAGAALGRPAPARGARPRAGQAAQAAAARRAAGGARPQAARGDALRAGAPAGAARPHLRHGDARPGGGDGDGEPPRRHERRPHRAGRHAARGLRAAATRASSPTSSASPTSCRTGDGRRWLALRPEKIALARAPAATRAHAVAGKIVDVAYEGDRSLYRVATDDGRVLLVSTANVARTARDLPPRRTRVAGLGRRRRPGAR